MFVLHCLPMQGEIDNSKVGRVGGHPLGLASTSTWMGGITYVNGSGFCTVGPLDTKVLIASMVLAP